MVTPLHPTGWTPTFDGETVSLDPSIGNWGFPSRSHYIIDRNRIVWADDMSREAIDRGHRRDRAARDWYFGGKADAPGPAASASTPEVKSVPKARGFLSRLFGL